MTNTNPSHLDELRNALEQFAVEAMEHCKGLSPSRQGEHLANCKTALECIELIGSPQDTVGRADFRERFEEARSRANGSAADGTNEIG